MPSAQRQNPQHSFDCAEDGWPQSQGGILRWVRSTQIPEKKSVGLRSLQANGSTWFLYEMRMVAIRMIVEDS